ncbi:glycoside hydrolase family 3 C-terminal domain-containing protein [Microbacterium sp. ARD31]|uniref:glycoside hydrolase family 3 protein n=1 Tax=Microbacterium sp. ARD31 TaxID=2962576 RepID=UPI00288203CF|nr:glycoside hydrolase family 3 C-terminal domain-containing protein [Microbacterium sp. ARD31]MDT0181754.1 glycoside hydrolase family 3 C-terminal domain-containing protein [Microbacterium sp. ARD31]
MTAPTRVQTPAVAHLVPLLEKLTLEQKAALVQGADFWTTVPLPHIGLRAMTLSDGPAGVRGPRWDEREPSLNLPSGSALAASWDEELAYRYGAAAASEARRKGVDVVLGPTINLHRSPLGGRHFECLSEDPELTAGLGAAYVRGMQDNGVGACPKHFVANDSETDRFTVDVQVDDRALRELYLAPFERAVDEAGAWTIMSAYNSVHGVTMTENDLLETPLNSEWGFDGVVISDWTAVRSLGSIPAAQDLAMPGPAPAWADLVDAVRDGRVDEADLDRKVLRLLLLAERVGALEGSDAAAPAPVDGPAFAREASIEGTVLLANDGVLPLDPGSLSRVAVIGHNAREARTQGGGSATVLPEKIVSPLDGIRAALADAQVTYEIGAVVQEGVAEIPLDQLVNPVTGEPGLRVGFFGADGAELFAEDRRATALVWFGGDAPIGASRTVVLETRYTPAESGEIQLGFAGANPGKLFVDGDLVLDDAPVLEGTDLGAAFLNPPSLTAAVRVEAGRAIAVRAEFTRAQGGPLDGALSVTLGIAPERTDPAALIARAVAAAEAAEVAVVVVGTNSKVESEGYDRENLDLPGHQDDLVRAVAATGTPTVVVVNAGSPVVLPWADEVSAVVQGYFGGQEFGAALADVLTGAAEPGGRLPTTWPAALSDVPVTEVVPTDGVLRYTEGIHIGSRAWLKADAAPAFPFGHGLGYTTWSWGAAQRVGDDVEVTLANTGDRPGKQVVQVYAERPDSTVERPVRWLVGYAVVRAEAGQTVTARIPLPTRRFAHWAEGAWRLESGEYTLRAGASVVDLPLDLAWQVQA